MNLKIITIKIISLALIFSQTDNQISKAKEIIKKTGMSEAEVINAAKAQGYSERQINDVINREKGKLKNKQENNISIEDQQNVFQDNTNSSNNLYEDQQIENEDIEIVLDENDAEQEKILLNLKYNHKFQRCNILVMISSDKIQIFFNLHQ